MKEWTKKKGNQREREREKRSSQKEIKGRMKEW